MEISEFTSTDKATVVIQINPKEAKDSAIYIDGQEARGTKHNAALKRFFKAQLKALGTVQIMTGVMAFLLGIVLTKNYIFRTISLISGITYWGSFIYISAGSLSVAAQNKLHPCVVHQAKALKQMHEGSTDPRLMQELHTVTDLALWATKVKAWSLGQVMYTLVVQECHLWLNLVEMRDVDKVRFLDAPISQVGLFGDTVEDFVQQFSAVQRQTEAIKHILPQHSCWAICSIFILSCRQPVKASLGMNLFSAITAAIAIVLMSMDLAITPPLPCSHYYDDGNCTISKVFAFGIIGILLVFSILQFIISICISAFACNAACNTESTVVNVALNQRY